MHYAYCPCDNAIISLYELRERDYELQPKLRIMNDEITRAGTSGRAADGPPLQRLVDRQRLEH
jgi:hypothetical protein